MRVAGQAHSPRYRFLPLPPCRRSPLPAPSHPGARCTAGCLTGVFLTISMFDVEAHPTACPSPAQVTFCAFVFLAPASPPFPLAAKVCGPPVSQLDPLITAVALVLPQTTRVLILHASASILVGRLPACVSASARVCVCCVCICMYVCVCTRGMGVGKRVCV